MPLPHIPGNLLLQWHLTERCNLRCTHCYQDSFAGDEPDHSTVLSILDQFRQLLISWRRQKAPVIVRGHLTVTGGEPFLRSDFIDLLQTFSANRDLFSFAILTNGTLIDKGVASRLKKLNPSFVQVSMEGSRETHDRIRGPGAFLQTVAAIRCLVKEGVRTFISFTAHADNYLEFPSVADIARELKVARVWADRLIPSAPIESRATGGKSPRTLNPSETFHLFKLMRKARDSRKSNRFFPSRTEVSMGRGLQFLVGGGTPYHCTAGDSLVCIVPNGDVYPCRRMPIKVGNVLEASLAEIYHESEVLQALRDRARIGEGCRRCFFAQACHGGLRCLSHAVTGSPFEADPGCWLSESV